MINYYALCTLSYMSVAGLNAQQITLLSSDNQSITLELTLAKSFRTVAQIIEDVDIAHPIPIPVCTADILGLAIQCAGVVKDLSTPQDYSIEAVCELAELLKNRSLDDLCKLLLVVNYLDNPKLLNLCVSMLRLKINPTLDLTTFNLLPEAAQLPKDITGLIFKPHVFLSWKALTQKAILKGPVAYMRLLKTLVTLGIRLDYADGERNTLLHYVIGTYDSKLINITLIFLKQFNYMGVLDQVNDYGLTPIELAVVKGGNHLLTLLREFVNQQHK